MLEHDAMQDQLLVMRASLLVAQKQRQGCKSDRGDNTAPNHSAAAAADVQANEAVADSPKKRKDAPDQASRALRQSAGSQAAADVTVPEAGCCGSSQSRTHNTVVDKKFDQPCTLSCTAAETSTTSEAATLQGCTATSSTVSQQHSGSNQHQPLLQELLSEELNNPQSSTFGLSDLLSSAAGKLQKLVEHLTLREPSAAAELSVLHWQLVNGYGQLPGSRCSTGEDAADTSTANSIQEHHGMCSSNATHSHPLLAPTTADPELSIGTSSNRMAAAGAGPATAQSCLQDCTNVAAAARLFSGSTAQLQAPHHLSWYYLDGSRVRGPHDAALMIRWYCNGFIEQHLPVAAVLQQSQDSSKPPPLAAFVPMKQLLAQVGQGCHYQPYIALQQTEQQVPQQLGPQLQASNASFCQVQPVTMGLQQIAARLRDVALLEPRTVKGRNANEGPSTPMAAGQLMPVKEHQVAGDAAAVNSFSSNNAVNGQKSTEITNPSSSSSGSGSGSARFINGVSGWILSAGFGHATRENGSIVIPWDWWVLDGDDA
jgi:hypothetical protein